MKNETELYHGLTRGYGGRYLVVLPIVVGNYRQLAIWTPFINTHQADDAAKYFDVALKCLLPYTRPGTEPNFPGEAFEQIDVGYWLTEPTTLELDEDQFRLKLGEAHEKVQEWAVRAGFSVDDAESSRRREVDALADKKLVEILTRLKNTARMCEQTRDRVAGLRTWFEKVAGNSYLSRAMQNYGGLPEREAVRKASLAYLESLRALSTVLEKAVEKEKDESPKLAKENPEL